MKTYIKPETIAVEMQACCSMLASTGVKSGDTLGKSVVSGGDFYTKSDNAWDDYDE